MRGPLAANNSTQRIWRLGRGARMPPETGARSVHGSEWTPDEGVKWAGGVRDVNCWGGAGDEAEPFVPAVMVVVAWPFRSRAAGVATVDAGPMPRVPRVARRWSLGADPRGKQNARPNTYTASPEALAARTDSIT